MSEKQENNLFINAKGPCLRFIPYGGQNEVGKNLWLFQSIDSSNKSDFIMLDAGVRYPGHEQPGVDYLLSELKSLDDITEQIQTLVLTSVHESHAGGAHHIINKFPINKVIGSKLALESVKNRLEESKRNSIEWQILETRKAITHKSFKLVPFRVTSTSMQSFALVIEAQGSKVFYTGTYKLDQTPTSNLKMDISGIVDYCVPDEDKFGHIDVYIADSTNVEQEGYSASELSIIPNIENAIRSASGRVVFNTCNSNTVRIQNLFVIAKKLGRKVALLNKDAKEVFAAGKAADLFYIDDKDLISIRDIDNYADEEILILSTAPEADALRELELISTDKNLELQLKKGDTVMNSADPPPGMVRIMAQIADQFFLKDVKIIGGRNAGINVQTHALTEEMKFMFNIVRPKYFIPALGETRHLVRHAKLAVEVGLDPMSIMMLDNGDVTELKKSNLEIIGQVPTSELLINHDRNIDVDDKIMKDRETLSMEGVVMVSFSLNKKRKLVAGPVFSARACTFSKNKEWRAFCMMNTNPIVEEIDRVTEEIQNPNIEQYQAAIREYMTKVIKQQIGKKPSVIVFGSEV